MTKKTVFLIIFIFLLSFFLISAQSKGLINAPKIEINSLFLPINSVKNFFSELFYLKEENLKLKQRLYEAVLREKSNKELLEENKRLKELLSLKEQKKEVVAIANVISKGSNKFLKTMVIDKGSLHGIKKDMAVITFNGLIGKVLYTFDNFSEILLLTDPNFSVAVKVERTRTEGVLSGTGTNLCALKYIPVEEDIAVGDVLITSGMDGIFPEGIKVGVVKTIEKKRGFFQNIEVIPYEKDYKVEEVAIIKQK